MYELNMLCTYVRSLNGYTKQATHSVRFVSLQSNACVVIASPIPIAVQFRYILTRREFILLLYKQADALLTFHYKKKNKNGVQF